MPLPELRTPRLRLRPFAVDDVDALHAVWMDAGVRRFLWDDITRVMEKLGMSFDRDAPHAGLPARFYVLEGASMQP